MKRSLFLIVILVTLFSCSTVDNKNVEIKKSSPEFEKNDVYDFSILVGKSYPTIINNIDLTPVEMDILAQSEGLEIEATVEIAHYFKYFLRDRRDTLEEWIENSQDKIPYIKRDFEKEGLPIELIYLPFLESGYNPMAYSRVGAGGIWQFMPKTARGYGLNINWWTDERRSPNLATPFAIRHLKHLYSKFDSWYLALAAYNAGEGRVQRAMDKAQIYNYFDLIKTDALPRETRRYIHQYVAIIKIMKNLEKLGFKGIEWNLEEKYDSITVPGGLDLYSLCKENSIEWTDFKKINPEFRRKVTDPSRKSTIFIPKNKLEHIKLYLKNTKPITAGGYRYYTVRSGDSWSILSKSTKTPIESLKRLNSVSNNHLKIGQRVLLPITTKMASVPSINRRQKSRFKTHIVKSGDTISTISVNYNIKLSALYRENNLNSRSILKVGQNIKLPGYPIESKVDRIVTKKVKRKKIIEKKDTHKVVYGDTLSGISYRYNISINKLMTLNGIKNPSNIKVGQILSLTKQKSIYRVKSGDSIWLIAQRTKIPYKKLLSINNLNGSSRLKVGDRIRLY